jgi:hypothetical protein
MHALQWKLKTGQTNATCVVNNCKIYSVGKLDAYGNKTITSIKLKGQRVTCSNLSQTFFSGI